MKYYEYKECVTTNCNPIITAEENNRKFILNNPSKRPVKKIKVDGCLDSHLSMTGSRCDYLFEINNPMTEVIYLELKGRNIEKAYEQLINTVAFFQNDHSHIKKRTCYIVASKVPKSGQEIYNFKTSLKKRKIDLFLATNQEAITL